MLSLKRKSDSFAAGYVSNLVSTQLSIFFVECYPKGKCGTAKTTGAAGEENGGTGSQDKKGKAAEPEDGTKVRAEKAVGTNGVELAWIKGVSS